MFSIFVLYVFVEDIKDILKLFNNTYIFDPNILVKSFFVLSWWKLNCDWLIYSWNSPLEAQ